MQSSIGSVAYSGGIDSASLGYSEQYGSASGGSLQASGNQIVWGLNGNDRLYNGYSTDSQVLLGGTGNDAYHIQSSDVTIVYKSLATATTLFTYTVIIFLEILMRLV